MLVNEAAPGRDTPERAASGRDAPERAAPGKCSQRGMQQDKNAFKIRQKLQRDNIGDKGKAATINKNHMECVWNRVPHTGTLCIVCPV